MRKKQICFFEKSQYDKLSDGLAASESEFSAPRPPPNDGMSLALVIIVSIRPLYINQFRLHGALLLFLVTGAGAGDKEQEQSAVETKLVDVQRSDTHYNY